MGDKGQEVKNNEMWIMKSGSIYLPFTVRATRKSCISCYVKVKNVSAIWKIYKAQGQSCVKIRVEEIK